MNSRNAFIFLIAILLLVSQLVGENSTLVSVAGADNAEIQQSLKRGEEKLKNMAAAPAKSAPARSVEPALSLDDFYSSSEDADTSAENSSEEGDGAPEPVAAAQTASVPKGIIADTVNGVPIMPQIR